MYNMNNDDLIKEWKCWCVNANNEIMLYASNKNDLSELPDTGIQAIRLQFEQEGTVRYISGNRYYGFKNLKNNLIGTPSSDIIQSDEISQLSEALLVKESIDAPDEIDNQIFNLMIESE